MAIIWPYSSEEEFILQVKHQLSFLEHQIFTNDLYNMILSNYPNELIQAENDEAEEEYQEVKSSLMHELTQEQKTALLDLEEACLKNIKYAMKFGLIRGIYVCFQQYYQKDTSDYPYHDYVQEQILTMPKMCKCTEYYQRRTQINDLFGHLEPQIAPDSVEHLVSIYGIWEDRLHKVLQHSFYLGYRCALSVIKAVTPFDGATRMTEKILLTEHEIGFTKTCEERERWNDCLRIDIKHD